MRSDSSKAIIQCETLAELDKIIENLNEEVKREVLIKKNKELAKQGKSSLEEELKKKNAERAKERKPPLKEVDLPIGQDDMTELLDKKINTMIKELKKNEIKDLLDRAYMAYIFYYECIDKIDKQILELEKDKKMNEEQIKNLNHEKDKLSLKLSAAFTIVAFANKDNKSDESLNKTFKNFRELVKKTEDIKKLYAINLETQIKNDQRLRIKDTPFDYAVDRLFSFIDTYANKSGMISRYIMGDANSKSNENTHMIGELALMPTLENIRDGNGSEEDKLRLMEQAVIDIYWQVRKDQGSRDSRLANALEKFLNSPLGLNLPIKYGIVIPHQVHVTTQKINIDTDALEKIAKPDNMLLLLTTKQVIGSFAQKYKELIAQLSPESLKTNRQKEIRDLLIILEPLLKEKDEHKSENTMKETIIETYLSVKLDAEAKGRLFGQSNLATTLKKFLKNEFGMNKEEINNLGSHREFMMKSKS